MTADSPYHEGELVVQQRANEVQMARRTSRAIDARVPAGAMHFIAQQPMVTAGSIGGDDNVWASVLFGMPGFLQAQDDRTLLLDVSQSRSAEDDPLWENIKCNPQIGLLVIEFISRRRLRVNGRMRRATDCHYIIDVEAAYPNCPKYIQRRHWNKPTVPIFTPAGPSRRGSALEPSQMEWIEGADTFFVASAHPRHGVDASHRGGKPGFVHVPDTRTLRIPDYTGNSMFNTLGNFVSYPHAGLVFLDFEHGRVLQLSGRPEILWQVDDPCEETGGTQRYWQLQVQAWQESVLPFHFKWEFLDYSRFIPISKCTIRD